MYSNLLGKESKIFNIRGDGSVIFVFFQRGKFDYVSSTNVNAKRIGATGAKRRRGMKHELKKSRGQ